MTGHTDHVVLGRQLSHDGAIGQPTGVPITEIDRHLLIAGATGTGKSVTGIHAFVSGHAATDGPTILIDPKGDWAEHLARAHHARTGSLEHLTYFDTAEYLPRISFFDVRPHGETTMPRGNAVRAIAGHFLDIVNHLLPRSADAIRAPDVIRYLIIALFDPIHGDDVYSIDALMTAIYQLRRSRSVPSVSTDWAEDLLDGVTDGNDKMFDSIMQGTVTRTEKLYGSGYLRPLFNSAPDDPADVFRFDHYLQDDHAIIIDLGGLPKHGQQVTANVVLSLLWRALKRRHATRPNADLEQTLLFIDEVPQLAIEERLSDLFAVSRGYNLGLVPMLQYPAQLKERADDDSAYMELLNNCHSILAGKIPNDEELVTRLASSAMSEGEVRNRLGNLPQDRFLFKPATPRGVGTVPTHMIADLPLPPGHPEAPPATAHPDLDQFETDFEACRDRTKTRWGIEPDEYTAAAIRDTDPSTELSADTRTDLQATNYAHTLPLIDELPGTATYDVERDAVECETCGAHYAPRFDGLLDALTCHGSLADIDRSELPPVELNLSLTASEIEQGELTALELIALQLLYNIGSQRYDRREIDLVFDPVQEVLGQFGIDADLLAGLVDDDYLTRDTLHKYVYYTLTPEGRDTLNESHRRGVDWGHGTGDLTESLLHISGVDALARHFEETFLADPDSPVTDVVSYYEVPEHVANEYDLHGNVRLDVAGLTADGDIYCAGEVERSNNDRATAAIQDYDQLAALDLHEASWVVPSNKRGHEAVLEPLANPPTDNSEIDDATPRIQEYAESTRIPTISGVDAPGMTEIMTLNELRKQLSEPTLGDDDT